MIFQHTLEQVLDGRKTQTSRIVKPGDYKQVFERFKTRPNPDGTLEFTEEEKILEVHRNRRLLWKVGRDYAIQPGRGKPAVGRFKLIKIRREDVRDISFWDIQREGFNQSSEFWHVWCLMHDPQATIPSDLHVGLDWLEFRNRPAERYQAWVLDFELVRG